VKVYVDTSVLLRVVLGERGALRQWKSIDMALSSELIRVEALRTLDRARITMRLSDEEISERRGDLLDVLTGFHLARIDRTVLRRAAEPFPTALRTLDALHLSTALLARRDHPDLSLATHDLELSRAARAVGFRVLGVPEP
jgi:predicted nucleic acid-binding protein